jgi:transposase
MHDRASVHTAYIIRDLFQDMGVEVMVCPLYSPDLNPIENLWALMKAKIYKLYPELERAPDTEDTL